MASAFTPSAAVASGAIVDPAPFDVWDDEIRSDLTATLAIPRPIGEVEAVEAWIKRSWVQAGIHDADADLRRRFADSFRRLGFLPKYKSYGVKYAAPFGYTLFDLQDNSGFSVQLHEAAKVEAFHVLAVHPRSFLLLCGLPEWQEREHEFVAAWAADQPETAPIVFRPQVGDVAVVEDLSTVHTVIGCVLEEFATSSYDVVMRLYDQNVGREFTLPAQHTPVPAVLAKAAGVTPKRMVRHRGGWSASAITSDDSDIVIAHLPGMGLVARHMAMAPGMARAGAVDTDDVVTVFVLDGTVEVEVDGAVLRLAAGDVTALAPGSNFRLTATGGPARLSWCEVASKFAFEDLR